MDDAQQSKVVAALSGLFRHLFIQLTTPECKKEKRNSQCEHTDSQWGKQVACLARASQVWLAVNHNTSVTSGE